MQDVEPLSCAFHQLNYCFAALMGLLLAFPQLALWLPQKIMG